MTHAQIDALRTGDIFNSLDPKGQYDILCIVLHKDKFEVLLLLADHTGHYIINTSSRRLKKVKNTIQLIETRIINDDK